MKSDNHVYIIALIEKDHSIEDAVRMFNNCAPFMARYIMKYVGIVFQMCRSDDSVVSHRSTVQFYLRFHGNKSGPYEFEVIKVKLEELIKHREEKLAQP